MLDQNEHYAAELIPSTYASWRYCIETKCGQQLSPDFLQARITILSDADHHETKRFAQLYGDAHLNQVLAWFQQAAAEA